MNQQSEQQAGGWQTRLFAVKLVSADNENFPSVDAEGVAQTTTSVSPTSVTAANVTKRSTAGSWPETVIIGGALNPIGG